MPIDELILRSRGLAKLLDEIDTKKQALGKFIFGRSSILNYVPYDPLDPNQMQIAEQTSTQRPSIADITPGLGNLVMGQEMLNAYQQRGIEGLIPPVPSTVKKFVKDPRAQAVLATGVGLAGLLPWMRRGGAGRPAGIGIRQSGMVGYHASPYKFDKFSLENIGKGEGAAAFGHGGYFSESKAISGEGGHYWKQFDPAIREPNSGRGLAARIMEGRENTFENRQMALREIYRRQSDAKLSETGISQEFQKRTDDAIKALQNNDFSAYAYKVDVPDEHVKNFLDWDKPLSEQPKIVRDALKNEFKDIEELYKGSFLEMPTITGADLHASLRQRLGSQKAAADYLNSVGIKGIKYLSGMSRKSGEGARNLVVFDDSIIKVLKRNNEEIKR